MTPGGDPAPIATDEERRRCAARIEAWAADRLAEGPPVLAAGREPDDDRWHIRLQGSDKDVVTVWLSLRQRTLYHEAQMMPAPETRREEVYAFLLRRNASLPQLRFALGPEDAVYVVGELPIGRVDDEELDRVVGGSLAVVDDCYLTAVAMGYAGLYRRRPRRR